MIMCAILDPFTNQFCWVTQFTTNKFTDLFLNEEDWNESSRFRYHIVHQSCRPNLKFLCPQKGIKTGNVCVWGRLPSSMSAFTPLYNQVFHKWRYLCLFHVFHHNATHILLISEQEILRTASPRVKKISLKQHQYLVHSLCSIFFETNPNKCL